MRQRANRDPLDDDKFEMAEIAKRIVLMLYRNSDEIKPGTQCFEQINEDLVALSMLEKDKFFSVSYASRMKEVIQTGDFPLEIPYAILPQWQDHTKTNGTVYVITSSEYPGHCKIGATTIDVDRRAAHFSRRYSMPVVVAYQQQSFDPFMVERKVARVFSEFRVRTNIFGVSNEWYKIEPGLVSEAIEEYRLSTPPG